MELSEQNVRKKHEAEADEQRIGCAAFVSVCVRFGDHFVADDVEHGAACEGKRKGQNGGGDVDGEEADERADDLNDTRERREQEGSGGLHACGKHGRDDDHALGNVLQSDTARDDECLCRVS